MDFFETIQLDYNETVVFERILNLISGYNKNVLEFIRAFDHELGSIEGQYLRRELHKIESGKLFENYYFFQKMGGLIF